MIPLFNAVGLQTQQFSDIKTNLEQISIAIDLAYAIGSQELPVKLICLAESAIQGFPDFSQPIRLGPFIWVQPLRNHPVYGSPQTPVPTGMREMPVC